MSALIEDVKMPKTGKYDVKLASEGDGNGQYCYVKETIYEITRCIKTSQ